MPNKYKSIQIYMLFLLVLALVSCGSSHPNPVLLMQTSSDARSDKLNAELAQKTLKFNKEFPATDYKLGPEDLLDIEVFQVEELKTSVRVSATGEIKLPLIGKTRAAGLTASELESQISKQLEEYLEEPMVSVFIKGYRSQRITVLGAVKNPQVYSISGQKHLLDMLSIAGGLTGEAGSICYVQKMSRGNSSNEDYIGTIVVDLDELLMNGNADLNISLSAGDVVHVPKSGVFFVDGAVEIPGSFQIKGKTTITQALSMTKGLKYEASRSDIRIYRDNGKDERDVIHIDYDSILNGKNPDIFIKDRDIIIVPISGVKNFFSGFIKTLKGFFSFGKAL